MSVASQEDTTQGVSVVDPIGMSIHRMIDVLFKPFRTSAWFGIGFMAFLASNIVGLVANVGLQAVGQLIEPAMRYRDDERVSSAVVWYEVNQWLFWLLVAAIACLVVGIVVLLTWLRSRGILMVFHGLATGSGSVPGAWRRSRVPGNSLFRWRMLVLFCMCVAFLACGVVLFLVLLGTGVFEDRARGSAGVNHVGLVWGIFGTIALVIAVALGGGVVNGVIGGGLAPIMYIKECTLLEAVRIARAEILPGQFWTVVGFLFFQIALLMGAQLAIQILAIVTCCVGVLPYIGSVLQLPVLMVLYAYPLAFYQQFGPDWSTLPVAVEVEPASGQIPPTSPDELGV